MLPLLPFFLMYAAGLTAVFPASQQFILPFFLPVLAGLAGLFLFGRSKKKSRVQWLVLGLFLPVGLAAPGLEDRFRPANHILNLLQEGQRANVIGVLAESPKIFPKKIQYLIELETIAYGDHSQATQGRARITLYQPSNAYHAGDRLEFLRIKLKRPRNFKNPGNFDPYPAQQATFVSGHSPKKILAEPEGECDGSLAPGSERLGDLAQTSRMPSARA